MEMNPIMVVLMAFGRTYCGLDAEEAYAVADKTLELFVADGNNDYVDLFDLFDDVWAASLLKGTISESENTTPIHPLSERDHMLNLATSPEEYEALLLIPEENWPKKKKNPKRYEDKKFVAVRKKRNRKRRVWDKEV